MLALLLPIRTACSCALKRGCMRTNHLSWAILPCRAVFCGILPSAFLNKLKYILKSRVVIPVFPLLTSFRMLNCRISCLLQPMLPLTFTLFGFSSLFMSKRVNASPTHLVDNLHQEIVINILTWLLMRRIWFYEMSSSKLQIKGVSISFQKLLGNYPDRTV